MWLVTLPNGKVLGSKVVEKTVEATHFMRDADNKVAEATFSTFLPLERKIFVSQVRNWDFIYPIDLGIPKMYNNKQ